MLYLQKTRFTLQYISKLIFVCFYCRRSCFHQLLGCQMGHFCARHIYLCQIDSFGCNYRCWFCPTWYVIITWFHESWIFYLLLFYREKNGFSIKKITVKGQLISEWLFGVFNFQKNIKKTSSKVAHNRPQAFISQVRPGYPNQPRIDFLCYKYVPRPICSLICAWHRQLR